MCTEYNGWSNRETWSVNLYIDNERELYERVQDLMKMASEHYDLDGEWIDCLAYNLKELFEELFDIDSLFEYRSLLIMAMDIGSIYRVNWHEIAKTKQDDMKASV